MNQLIELAEKIKDKNLREKTIKLLKDPQISNAEINYPKADLKKMPAWVNAHHFYEGGLAEHTASVTELSISIAKTFEKIYSAKINMDFLISGALLHDIMKVFIVTKENGQWELTRCVLDHAVFSASELYARGFPEEVIHIVASHGGDLGASCANPKTKEALIVLYADMLDSAFETSLNANKDFISLLLSQKQ